METATEIPPVPADARQAAWLRRRPEWLRTDTARWLNERSPLVLAWLRRRDEGAPHKESHAMGRWLQMHREQIFTRAHRALLEQSNDARDRLGVLEVLK